MQYERRTPEDTILYQTIEKYLSEFRAQTQETDRNLPDFVFEEIEAYLKCGLLSHGFARVYCDSGKESSLVAFSCKKRGFCPSCCGRRMAQTAAHQVDHIFPEVPVRQWVLTFPFFLRSYIAYNPDACTDALDVFMDVLRQKYRELCLGGLWIDNYWINGGREVHYDIGSCTSFQRFNGALALFPHYHSLLCMCERFRKNALDSMSYIYADGDYQFPTRENRRDHVWAYENVVLRSPYVNL